MEIDKSTRTEQVDFSSEHVTFSLFRRHIDSHHFEVSLRLQRGVDVTECMFLIGKQKTKLEKPTRVKQVDIPLFNVSYASNCLHPVSFLADVDG